MKKARDYAKQFSASPTEATLRMIIKSFVAELGELVGMRKAQTNDAALSILDEQDRKWRAFARLVEGINPDGFVEIIRMLFPWPVYSAWLEGRKKQ